MIWKPIELTWAGETHVIRPTLDLLNHIESQPGCSTLALITRASNGDMPIGVACSIVARTLNWIGVKTVTPEAVFSEAVSGGSMEVIGQATEILVSFYATEETGKKKPVTDRKPVATRKKASL